MNPNKNTTEYWFTIDPYVYVCLTDTCTLLYNTLDGVTIESDKVEVLGLIRELLIQEKFGVILLSEKRFMQKDINDFIREIREKYMGDVIDVKLSNGKPIQLMPYFNYSSDKLDVYKKLNSPPEKNALENLFEISIHVDDSTDLTKLIPFLQAFPGNLSYNIMGNIWEVKNHDELLSFLDQLASPKTVICSYLYVTPEQLSCESNFLHRIIVDFPVDMLRWNEIMQIVASQASPVEYVFNISSKEEYFQAEQLAEQFQIEKYQMTPVYNGDNIEFFEENVFITKEDILSTPISIKDIFSRQAMNMHDFGKINIMPNGDAYANVNHPALGNVYKQSLAEIVGKEMTEGQSWFRIRNQEPCNGCIYQWLCPSPSDYEIVIGRPNLCHVKRDK